MFKNFFCIPIDLYVFMFLLATEHSPSQTIPTLFFFLRLSMGVPFYNFFKVLFWLKRWTISDNYSFQKTLDYKKPSQTEKYRISQERWELCSELFCLGLLLSSGSTCGLWHWAILPDLGTHTLSDAWLPKSSFLWFN